MDFGNCWDRGTVKVYLNGNEIGAANPNTPSKVITFDYTDGSKLKMQDEGANSVMQFNRFDVLKLSNPHQVNCI